MPIMPSKLYLTKIIKIQSYIYNGLLKEFWVKVIRFKHTKNNYIKNPIDNKWLRHYILKISILIHYNQLY